MRKDEARDIFKSHYNGVSVSRLARESNHTRTTIRSNIKKYGDRLLRLEESVIFTVGVWTASASTPIKYI